MPVVAGITGMLVPAGIFLALNSSGDEAAGWGAVIGTDTAFLLGVMALVGPAVSTQLRIFLLTLTVIDDIVAVSVIGVVYSDDLAIGALLVAAACLVVLVGLDRAGVWQAAPYVLVVLVLWVATLESGVHASIAGMLSGLLVPALDPRRVDVEDAMRTLPCLPAVADAGRAAGRPAHARRARSRSTSGCRRRCTRRPATSSYPCSRSPTPGSTCATASSATPSPPG